MDRSIVMPEFKANESRSIIGSLLTIAFTLIATITSTGCSTLPSKEDSYRYNIQQGNLAKAGELISASYNQGRDKLLKDLHSGTINQLKGEYKASNDLLETGKRVADELSSISVSETAAAITINQRLSQFSGNRFERVMIYFHKALNYVTLGDYSSARIEMSQAELLMRELRIQASVFPFIPLMLGLIYESLADEENALVAYRRAVAAYGEVGEGGIPDILKQSYVDLLAKNGRRQEMLQAERQMQVKPSNADNSAKLIIIAGRGVMTPVGSFTIYYDHPELAKSFLIALPFYPDYLNLASYPQIRIDDATIKFKPIIDIEYEMRLALAQEMPTIITLALARAVVKSQFQQQADDNDVASLLVFVFNTATEIADTRSWDSLPQVFYFGRLSLPPGEYSLNNRPNSIKLKAGVNFIYLSRR